jgi:endonuclease/exonuclease/phosphatase family metal-dependent hydrolase
MKDTLRVVSWNVREGRPPDPDLSRTDALAEITGLLNDLKIDVAALQEVDFDESGNSDILDAICSETKLSHCASHVLSESSFFQHRYAGVALASRFPLRDSGRALFTNPQLSIVITDGSTKYSHDKGLVAATIDHPDLEISIISLHCVPFNSFGRRADDIEFGGLWKETAASLESFSRGASIVCGDFNTHRRDLVMPPGSGYLTQAMAGQPTQVDDAIDDILFTPRHFSLVSASTRDNYSDHRLCIADLAGNPGLSHAGWLPPIAVIADIRGLQSSLRHLAPSLPGATGVPVRRTGGRAVEAGIALTSLTPCDRKRRMIIRERFCHAQVDAACLRASRAEHAPSSRGPETRSLALMGAGARRRERQYPATGPLCPPLVIQFLAKRRAL